MGDKEIIQRVRERHNRDIPTKAENYALYRQGAFGNRALAWDNLDELHESGWQGGVCIRDRRGTQRGNKWALLPRFNIPYEKIDEEVKKLISQGIPSSAMTYNQLMPDQHLTIQGEVTRILDGTLHLTYSDVQKPMRLALLEKTMLSKGLEARLLLRKFLWPASLGELDECLDYFSIGSQIPTPTVEFSSYAVSVGDILGRNTVIWEVRNY